MDITKLLPCPFCGFEPDINDPDCLYPVTREKDLWNINCYETGGGCSCYILGGTPEECIEKWQKRC